MASNLTTAALSLKSGFNSLFINSSGIVCDGKCVDTPHTAVHSSFYALAFGLLDDTHVSTVATYIRDRITTGPLGMPCGPYTSQFLITALYMDTIDHGMSAYDVITSSAMHSWSSMMQVC